MIIQVKEPKKEITSEFFDLIFIKGNRNILAKKPLFRT